MEILDKLEIYIPVEAEVKTIPLRSLPHSVLRRMGLPRSDPERSLKPTDSPEAVWICPAVIRRKGQKLASHTGNGVIENVSSLLGREFRAAPSPLQMSFVSANRTAYKVLKGTMPDEKVIAHTSHGALLPQGSAPQTYKGAVVIYHGRIYLSTRKPDQSRSQREAREPQPSAQSSIPSASRVSSKSKKKRQSPQASLKPADKELKRKKFRVSLPQTSTKQELLHDNRPKQKHAPCKSTHSKNKQSDVSSSTSAHSVPQSSDGVDRADSHEPAWFQPQGQQEEASSNDRGECEMQDASEDEAHYMQTYTGAPEDTVGVAEQSWPTGEIQGAACGSTTRREEFDFKELAGEEKIAQMMAKLRQSEAALSSLHSSK